MMHKILITGASGLIGTRLTEILIQRGHEVSHLGRSGRKGSIQSFTWNVESGEIEEEALRNVDTVIHLAGANVNEKRWTPSWKKQILESRTKSTAFLAQCLQKNSQIKTLICASAIGYYGFSQNEREFTEESPAGNDFLATVVKAWEDEANKIDRQRVVKFRVGIALSSKGGALMEMVRPIRWGVGASLGTGKQYLSWIHIDDVCNMFLRAVEDEKMTGVFNATAPEAVTNSDLTKAIAKILSKPLWLPAIPQSALQIILGDMTEIIVNGSKVLPRRIQQTDFKFQYANLNEALQNLLKG